MSIFAKENFVLNADLSTNHENYYGLYRKFGDEEFLCATSSSFVKLVYEAIFNSAYEIHMSPSSRVEKIDMVIRDIPGLNDMPKETFPVRQDGMITLLDKGHLFLVEKRPKYDDYIPDVYNLSVHPGMTPDKLHDVSVSSENALFVSPNKCSTEYRAAWELGALAGKRKYCEDNASAFDRESGFVDKLHEDVVFMIDYERLL